MDWLTNVPWLPPLAAALLGAWAAVMAHKGWANYHDGVRPLLAEQANGGLSRDELVEMAREANRPFIGGGLGLSILAGVPLAHWMWLPAEVSGYRARRVAVALALGAVWGFVAWAVVWGIRTGAAALPVPLGPSWLRAATVLMAGALATPALAVGHRHGTRWGVVALLATATGAWTGLHVLAEFAGSPVAAAAVGGIVPGLVCFVALLWRRDGAGGDSEAMTPLVPRRVPLWAIVVQGAVLALAIRAGTFGWSTADGVAASQQWWPAGAAVTATLALAFLPHWTAAFAITGMSKLMGLGLAGIAGFLAPAPLWAPLLGAAAVLIELQLLPAAMRRSELREAGESLRWATGKLGHATVLAGCVWGAADLLPAGLGVAIVLAVAVFNDLLERPLWNTAAPAWGLVLAGLIGNGWSWLGGL